MGKSDIMFEDFRIRIFLEVASEGSFTKASRNLGISQPAVSQNISELEKSLGCQLFERMRGEVALTDSGKAFQQYARNIIHWYHAAGEMFHKNSDSPVSSLSILSDSFLSDYVLPDVLFKLKLASENSRFTVRNSAKGDEEALLRLNVRSEGLDFEGMNSLIGIVQASMAASARVIDSVDKEKLSLENIPIAVWSRYEPYLPLDMKARVAMVSDSVGSVISFVKNSSSLVAIIPQKAVLSSDGIEEIPYPLPYLQMDIHLKASSPSVEKSSTFQSFRSILEDSLK